MRRLRVQARIGGGSGTDSKTRGWLGASSGLGRHTTVEPAALGEHPVSRCRRSPCPPSRRRGRRPKMLPKRTMGSKRGHPSREGFPGVRSTSRNASLRHFGKHFGTLARASRLRSDSLPVSVPGMWLLVCGRRRAARASCSLSISRSGERPRSCRTSLPRPPHPGCLSQNASHRPFGKHFGTLGWGASWPAPAPARGLPRPAPGPPALPRGLASPQPALAARTHRATPGGTAPPRRAPREGHGRSASGRRSAPPG